MSNPTAPKLALADAIRALAMDAVQQSELGRRRSMGMAEIAQALWIGNLRHNPKDPAWANRDRFVLSNGHGSMLIYALLHLTGYDLPIEELKNFRQLHSKTPGHPEVGITRAWKPPPARWARAWAMPSAWRWPKRCWPPSSTSPATPSSTTTPMPSPATAA